MALSGREGTGLRAAGGCPPEGSRWAEQRGGSAEPPRAGGWGTGTPPCPPWTPGHAGTWGPACGAGGLARGGEATWTWRRRRPSGAPPQPGGLARGHLGTGRRRDPEVRESWHACSTAQPTSRRRSPSAGTGGLQGHRWASIRGGLLSTRIPVPAPPLPSPPGDRCCLWQQPCSSGRSGRVILSPPQAHAVHRECETGPRCAPTPLLGGPPTLPGSPHLWTLAWAVGCPHRPQWPDVPARAGAPRTRWCHRPTRAGSPQRRSWPWGRWAAECPGRRTGGHCTRMCRRQTGSRSRRRSSRRSLGGADRGQSRAWGWMCTGMCVYICVVCAWACECVYMGMCTCVWWCV